MKVLLHYKIDRVESFLKEFKTLHYKYKIKDFKFAENFNTLSDACILFFEEINDQEFASKIRLLQTEYFTALAGIHPITLEKIRIEKRTMQWSFAFKNLSYFEEIIQSYLANLNHQKKEAEELIQQIILAGFQNKIIKIENLENRKYNVEKLWERLTSNFQLRLLSKKLLFQLNSIDVLLLAEKNFDRILSSNPIA